MSAIAVGSAIGTAVIGGTAGAAIGSVGGALVGGALTKRSSDRSAAQKRAASKEAAAAADPFRAHRGQYASMLSDLYSTAQSPYGGTRAGLSFSSPMSATIGSGGQVLIGHDQTGAPITGRELSASEKMQDWMASNPAYQFARDEGIRGLSRSAAARGMLQSGNYMRDLVQYSSGLATQTYNAEVNRLMTLSGATVGSPATAGQIAAQGGMSAAATQAAGTQQALGQIGYGIQQGIGAFGQSNTGQILSGQQYNTNPMSQQSQMLAAQEWGL